MFSLTGFRQFSEHDENKLLEQAELAVFNRADSKNVFDTCVNYLNQKWIALPALYRLQKVVNQALKQEENRLFAIFKRELKGDIKKYITSLLAPQRTTDEFNTLRHQAKDFTFGELSRELQDKKKLTPVFIQAKQILKAASISDGNIRLYSELFQNYRTSQLKQFSIVKASIYVISFLSHRYGHINDNLTNGFYRGIKKYYQAATAYANEHIAKEAVRLGTQAKKVSDVLYVLAKTPNDENLSAQTLLDQIYRILPQPDLTAVADFMSKVELDKKKFFWKYYSTNKAAIRRNLRRLFLALEFEIDKTHPKLVNQVTLAKYEIQQHGEIKTIDEELIRPSDLAYFQNSEAENSSIDPFLFECYLYRKVFQALDNDICYIHHSHQHRPLSDFLVNKSEQNRLGESMSLPMLKVSISDFCKGLNGSLTEQIKKVSKRINQGENNYVIYSNQTNTIKWSLSVKNTVPKVNNGVFEQFDPIGIIDLMRVVNQETQFFNEFIHFQSKQQRTSPNLNDILACILGNGTNFGLYKIANISDRSFNDLRTAQANYLRVDTLRAANDVISNKTASLPIFEYYEINENGHHGSIDGQKFECRFSSLMARYKTFKDQFERMFQVESSEDEEKLITLKTLIDWQLIIQEWDNICQLMISLGQHKTSQSVLIKKLCRYKSTTATLKAMAEYDRAIKAQYILDYTDNETLRHHVQRALNRGEAFHQLRRVIAETNGKKFRGSHHAELTLWNECARLIANCVIHYNAQILSELKEFNESKGEQNNLEALKRISPVAWYHINSSGFYSFADSEKIQDFEELARTVYLTI